MSSIHRLPTAIPSQLFTFCSSGVPESRVKGANYLVGQFFSRLCRRTMHKSYQLEHNDLSRKFGSEGQKLMRIRIKESRLLDKRGI